MEEETKETSVSSPEVVIEEPEWAPPDGGYGWVIVAVSFTLNVLFASMAQTGMLLIEWQHHFDLSVSQVSWLNTFHTVFGRLLGIFIGPLIGRLGCRWMVLIGGVMLGAGHAATSLAPNLPFMYFTYGTVQSMGSCIYFSAAIVCVQQYFNKKRSVAAGIGCSGVNVGFFIWPPFAAWLLQKFGWQRTFQIEAVIQLAGGILCCILLRPPHFRSDQKQSPNLCKDNKLPSANAQPEGKSQSNPDVHDVEPPDKSRMCSKIRGMIPIDTAPLYYVSWWMFMGYISLNTCNFAFTSFYSPLRSELLGLSTEDAAMQLSLMGILSTVFTPVYAVLGNYEKLNRRMLVGLGTIIAGICSSLSASFTTQTQLLIYACLFGIAQAPVFGCDYSIIVDILGMKNVAAGGGWYVVAMGMGHLVVQPSAGFLVDLTGSTKLPFILYGILGSAGGLLVILSVLVQKKVDKTNYSMDPSSSSADLVAMSGTNKARLVSAEPATGFRVFV